MKERELDARFDKGEDITTELDFAKARRPRRDVHRVNVDFPARARFYGRRTLQRSLPLGIAVWSSMYS